MSVQLPSAQERMRFVAVHAHPDDESSKGAGTMAKYVRDGAEVTVITCTGGERGDILNPRMHNDPTIRERLVEVRRQEMANAQQILGIDHEWLGFVDSGLPEGDPFENLPEGCFATLSIEEAAKPLVEAFRRLRPHVVSTYDENGGYPHPDHIQCHRVTMAAAQWAADPGYCPELGEPWSIIKLYYVHGFNRQRLDTVARYLRELGQPNAELEGWLQHFDPRRDRLITTRIDVRDYLDVRDAALLAHTTQVDPDGIFFTIPHDVEIAAWGTEDYELRFSRVGVTLPENDLFAGLHSDEPEATGQLSTREPAGVSHSTSTGQAEH